MSANLAALSYLVASVCFIMALKGLSSPETARHGNIYGIAGMVIAIGTTLALPIMSGYIAVAVAAAAFYAPDAYGIGTLGAIHRQSLVEMSLGTAIGAITFTGSVVAFA